jgi:flagellar biosynthesis protein FlhG
MDSSAQPRTSGRIISIGGGKGGVGKSIVAANVAVALARTVPRVVLVDLDLGAANQHLLLGVGKHRPGVSALLAGTLEDIEQSLTPTGVPGLSLLAGTGAVFGAANITFAQKRRLVRKLRQLNAVVVLDVGAGVAFNALDFFLLGDQKVVVTTPQVTAIHDAYSFLKGAVLRMIAQNASRQLDLATVAPALISGEGAKVVEIFDRLRGTSPELADKIGILLSGFGAHLVGNFVARPSDVGVFWSVTRMMREFLGIEVPVLGWLPTDSGIADSVNARRPLVLGPRVEAVRSLQAIADTLLLGPIVEELEVDIEVVEDDGPVIEPAPIPLAAMAAAAPAPTAPGGPPPVLPGLTPALRTR